MAVDKMQEALDYILSRYPDHKAKIIEFFNSDEDFRILCQDYYTSATGLEGSRHNSIKNREVENEYSQVYIELEKEIIHLLERIDRIGVWFYCCLTVYHFS
jgi:hypothetical protein